MAITSNRQETVGRNYVNQCLNATSATHVLSEPSMPDQQSFVRKTQLATWDRKPKGISKLIRPQFPNSNRLKESIKVFKRRRWSKEEDAMLLNWVAADGPHKWRCIKSKGVLLRSGKSCRLRWVNKLRPGPKKERKFSGEEKEVVKLQACFGDKWARTAKLFLGRTDNNVKNLWSTCKKRLARKQRGPLPSISRNAADSEVQIYQETWAKIT